LNILEHLDIVRLAAAFRLGLASPAEVVDWAMARLAECADDRLVRLANLSAPRDAEVQEELDELLVRLGHGPVDDLRAAAVVARAVAQDIVNARIPPQDGSRLLWWRVARKVPQVEPGLRPFIGLASEWEDDPDARADYERDMLTQAQALLDDDEFARAAGPPGLRNG
jgi:hypothetical protein